MNRPIAPSANFHFRKFCDQNCVYCFAVFDDVPGQLKLEEMLNVLTALRAQGVQKINFAGGEPTLYEPLEQLLHHARALGFVTCIVTNGRRLEPLLEHHANAIDWVTLSVDSGEEATQAALGRTALGGYVKRLTGLATLCHEARVRLKLNTVLTRLNCDEDMTQLVIQIRPERWKVFQVLPIAGQNDGKVDDLLITGQQFSDFVHYHQQSLPSDIVLVPENNEAMSGSYAMIDPLGRFFDNISGKHQYSDPILEVGVEQAWQQIEFLPERFEARGGNYDWKQAGCDDNRT